MTSTTRYPLLVTIGSRPLARCALPDLPTCATAPLPTCPACPASLPCLASPASLLAVPVPFPPYQPLCLTRPICPTGPTRPDSLLNLEHEPIIGQLNTMRQTGARRPVRQVVADVRKVRALGSETIDDRERFADAEVRRMGPLPQRIENDGAHAVEERPRRVRNTVAIGQVREAAHAEPQNRQIPVKKGDRNDLRAPKRKRTRNPEQRELGEAASDL